jgi:hypothetical protein
VRKLPSTRDLRNRPGRQMRLRLGLGNPTQKTLRSTYPGVGCCIQKGELTVHDGTSPPSPKMIQFTDLIGQPTWIDVKIWLSYLGPEIVRALLAGSQSNALTPSRLLRPSKNLPHDSAVSSVSPPKPPSKSSRNAPQSKRKTKIKNHLPKDIVRNDKKHSENSEPNIGTHSTHDCIEPENSELPPSKRERRSRRLRDGPLSCRSRRSCRALTCRAATPASLMPTSPAIRSCALMRPRGWRSLTER